MFDISTRQAKLIDLLTKNETYLPAKYFADQLNVSNRTIFNDLEKLKDVFKECNLVIDKKPNQGIKLIGNFAASKNLIQTVAEHYRNNQSSLSSLDRQMLIAKWLLVNSKVVTYNSMSMDLYTSSSSLIKDIENLRHLFGEDLKIISNSKGTKVSGKEIDIQKAIKRLAYLLINKKQDNYSLSSYAHALESLFDKKVTESVYDSVKKISYYRNRNIPEQYLKSFFISLLILTERSNRGFHLTSLPHIHIDGVEAIRKHPMAEVISMDIESKLGSRFTEIEHQYISNELFAHRMEPSHSNEWAEDFYSLDIREMIAEISQAIEIDLSNDENLFQSLISHTVPMIYRLKSDITINNSLLNEIKTNYGVLFHIIRYSIEKIEMKHNIKLTDDDISFITLHFQVAIERRKNISQVLVVCQSGIVTSELIIQRIENLLPANIKFNLISASRLVQEDLSTVDFIISSIRLNEINHPVVYVSPLVSDTDLKNIYDFYLNYSPRERKNDDQVLNTDLLSTFVNPRYIFLNEASTTKEECLNKMIGKLEEDRMVNSAFRESIYDRDILGNTVVQGWVAVPHALSSSVNETQISIMTTSKPVKWNQEEHVSVILLLAVAEKDVKIIRKLLSHLYKVILASNDYEQIPPISSFTDPDEFIEFLRKGKEDFQFSL
ncbi:BglG family transcription antiterminator [Sporosarcina cascadiensis]|uniref:BglG family transcription antiterminator n=1 Tax=Sporosarcina cascadiensis TaxID=2660747 RepID=UPI00189122D8|nr:BglG family transcription antiterminator [Sporosarcina cascadiensis]